MLWKIKKERRLHEQQFLRKKNQTSEEITILLHKKKLFNWTWTFILIVVNLTINPIASILQTVKTKGDHTMPEGATLKHKDLKSKWNRGNAKPQNIVGQFKKL